MKLVSFKLVLILFLSLTLQGKNFSKVDDITAFCNQFIYSCIQQKVDKELEKTKFTPQEKKLIAFPKVQFYMSKVNDISLDTKVYFSSRKQDSKAIKDFILQKYKSSNYFEDSIITKLSEELAKKQ